MIKLWNIKVTVIPIIIKALGTVTKGLIQGLKDVEIKDHPNYSIVEICQNNEESPGDLRRFVVVTQTPVKSHWLTLVQKTRKGVNNNNDNNEKRTCLIMDRHTTEWKQKKGKEGWILRPSQRTKKNYGTGRWRWYQ